MPTNRTPQGYVYFAVSEFANAVKIGHSTWPQTRVVELDRCSAVPIKLVWSMCGTRARERALHKRFAHLRERYEWFRFDPEIREFIADLQRRGVGTSVAFVRKIAHSQRSGRPVARFEQRSAG